MRLAFIAQPIDGVLPPHQNSIGIIVYETARRLAQSCTTAVYLRGSHIRKRCEGWEGVEYRYIPMDPDKWLLRLFKKIWRLFNPKLPLFASKFYYLGYISQVALDLRLHGCDTVHILNFSQFVPIIRAFNPKITIVLEMQCEWLTQLDRTMIKQRLNKTDMIIGVSEHITGKIRRRFPEFSERCRTVFNGVDTKRFTPATGTQSVETNASRRMLFVGRVSPEKGVHVLLDAIKTVVKRYPNLVLEIIGSKVQAPLEFIVSISDEQQVSALKAFYEEPSSLDYYSYLKRQADELGIAKNVQFLGNIPQAQLVEHYRSADVLINPSFSESFGMALVEAMATEIPVIATRVGGMTEIVDQGKTGILVEPGDAPAQAKMVWSGSPATKSLVCWWVRILIISH